MTNGTKKLLSRERGWAASPQRTSDGLACCVFTSKLTTTWLKEETLRGGILSRESLSTRPATVWDGHGGLRLNQPPAVSSWTPPGGHACALPPPPGPATTHKPPRRSAHAQRLRPSQEEENGINNSEEPERETTSSGGRV